jgi:hypothetical protein
LGWDDFVAVNDRAPVAASGPLAGDSAEQRAAELLIVAAVANALDISLTPQRFALQPGSWVTVDGAADVPPVLVEAWAHQGPPKPAQKAKVIADALKLIWLDRTQFGGRARKILALADDAAAAHFQGRAWIAAALRDLDIEVRVVTLPDAVREGLRQAQKRQSR